MSSALKFLNSKSKIENSCNIHKAIQNIVWNDASRHLISETSVQICLKNFDSKESLRKYDNIK